MISMAISSEKIIVALSNPGKDRASQSLCTVLLPNQSLPASLGSCGAAIRAAEPTLVSPKLISIGRGRTQRTPRPACPATVTTPRWTRRSSTTSPPPRPTPSTTSSLPRTTQSRHGCLYHLPSRILCYSSF